MCVNANTCVCKVLSSVSGVYEASIAKPTPVSYLSYVVYTSVPSSISSEYLESCPVLSKVQNHSSLYF